MAGPMPYRAAGEPAPFTYADPSAPTLAEATAALDAANDFREKYLTERRNLIEVSARANRLEAEYAEALEMHRESESEATWHAEAAA